MYVYGILFLTENNKKMKKKLFSVLFIGWLFFPLVVNSGIIGYNNSEEIFETDPIDLIGDLDPGPRLRSISDLVTCELQGNIIISMFHMNVGNLLVAITNNTGDAVYNTMVNTSIQNQLFIPLLGLPSGIYTITFSNESGQLSGDFEI